MMESIARHFEEFTPQGLVNHLVRKLPESEQLRLLAWANMPRLEEFEGRKRSCGGSGDGPDPDVRRMVVETSAVAAGRL